MGTIVQQRETESKMRIKEQLGENNYAITYAFLMKHRNAGTDDALIHKGIKEIVGHDKKQLQGLCFQLDQIVFMELMREGKI
jgi:hypothetical protein